MQPRWASHVRTVSLVLGGFIPLLSSAAIASEDERAQDSPRIGHAHVEHGRFVQRDATELTLKGKPFRFAGTNNYYPMYKSRLMVDDILTAAAANGFSVFRLWAFLEDESEGVNFQYWDASTGKPAFDDGPDGLERLDYIVAVASRLGLKLVLPLTNNWPNFGGMDQYVRWREAEGSAPGPYYHSTFYTDPVIRGWYKAWIQHLLERRNVFTGERYLDDPTIMTWELANEPRCRGGGGYAPAPDCTAATLIAWADDVSRFIKSIDGNHLVSMGDEGFYCTPGAIDWTENCSEGDTVGYARLPAMDLLSFHLYPEHWGKTAAFAGPWIERHFADALAIGKPAMLGEFGWLNQSSRNRLYKEWTDVVDRSGGAGALFWLLSGVQDDGTLYPDYDGFTVYCPSPVCSMLSNFGQSIERRGEQRFPPVADHDALVTRRDRAVIFSPTANDVTYGAGNAIDTDTLDLDPALRGVQRLRSAPGGRFELLEDGSTLFTPEPGFVGEVRIDYTVRDAARQRSDVAEIAVRVDEPPPPSPPSIALFSFESGVEGWGRASFEADAAGSVAQTSAFATDGASSLAVDSLNGGWFGVSFATPLDLSDYSAITFDLFGGEVGSYYKIAIRTGLGFIWCEATPDAVAADTTEVARLDLLSLSCGTPERGALRDLLIYVNGDVAIDNVRAVQ